MQAPLQAKPNYTNVMRYCNVWLVTDNGECCGKYQDGSLDRAAAESAGFAEKAHSYTKGMRFYCDRLVGLSAQQEFLRKTAHEEVLRQIRRQPVYAVTYPAAAAIQRNTTRSALHRRPRRRQ